MKIGKTHSGLITRREFVKYGMKSSLVLGILSSFPGIAKSENPSKKPNVILIGIDTLRADHLGCYGYHRNTTPNIDKLAKEGILFKNAISTAPWTIPSFGSIMTSCYPSTLGIHATSTIVPDKFPCFARILKQNNFTTYGVYSGLYLRPKLLFGRGFDRYECAYHDIDIAAPIVSEKAVSFLSQKHDKPFFMFLHYQDPHMPFLFHPEHNFLSSDQKAFYSWKYYLEHVYPLRPKKRGFSKDDLCYLQALYDSEIAFTDKFIGRVLDEIRKLGLYDNSIIIVTSDHGEELYEKGFIGHQWKLYREMIHVPLVIRLPNDLPQVFNNYFSLIDIMPTVLEYLGLEIPEGIEGSALNLRALDRAPSKPVFSETRRGAIVDSVIYNGRKLIDFNNGERQEIYDLIKDPQERTCLTFGLNEEDTRLLILLNKWSNRLKGKKESDSRNNYNDLFDRKELERLKTLGYLN